MKTTLLVAQIRHSVHEMRAQLDNIEHVCRMIEMNRSNQRLKPKQVLKLTFRELVVHMQKRGLGHGLPLGALCDSRVYERMGLKTANHGYICIGEIPLSEMVGEIPLFNLCTAKHAGKKTVGAIQDFLKLCGVEWK